MGTWLRDLHAGKETVADREPGCDSENPLHLSFAVFVFENATLAVLVEYELVCLFWILDYFEFLL